MEKRRKSGGKKGPLGRSVVADERERLPSEAAQATLGGKMLTNKKKSEKNS
jgi:hypothetical protein